MTRRLRHLLAALLLVVTTAASASYHTFRLEELYSNADGSMQFVVLHDAESC